MTQGAIQRFFTKLTDDTTESEGLSKERSEDRINQQAAEDQGSPNPSSPALCEGTGSDDDSQNESEPDDFNPQSPEPPRPESPDSAASNDISRCLAEGSVQRSCAAPPGPDDISQSRADGPVQPVLKVFPKTQHRNRKRAFIETWYKDFTWLEYSVSRDSVYCYPCRHFSLPNAPMSIFRSESGFSNWKKALCRNGGFRDHCKSEHHRSAVFA
ncbi:uncharacterized protein LOC127629878 isoform X1 [Xyrauchen texanus]|uniref:uncharacterized protein LOC127629878 isoform X1 n=2 Tax=Xyrauchen texanus TaxID=154827 RepID=UPI002241AE53|nr:uncharacterized protein LOC127629878 isoform X1 [Xyrauchen texanus]